MKYSESLKKNKDFQYIYRKGKSYANKYLVMYVLENGTSQNRLGISVSNASARLHRAICELKKIMTLEELHHEKSGTQ